MKPIPKTDAQRRKKAKAYHAAHPEVNWRSKLKTNYGMTMEDYDAMLQAQDNKCAICGRDQADVTKRFAVDHDHDTSRVRALLCYNCNHGLADFGDSIVRLQQAVTYLKRHKPKPFEIGPS